MQTALSSPAELSAFLQERGFLTPLQVQQLRVSMPKFEDVRALARDLIERNWLTPYQANQLLVGRGEDLLLGSYRILDRLGEGGMGQVFKAHHVSMDRIIALKLIPKERMSDPTAVGRFHREVRAFAKLSHPNIVIAFEVNQAGQTPFLAMEFVDGIDLARLVQQSGPLPIARACEYIRQAAVGLQHAHEKGLVHRDIKPGNLMVTRPSPDEPPVIKILDFGLARFESESAQAARLTQLGKVVGTVDYIAPEQAQNPRTADIRADIYSLGCSLFYLLTGKPPFPGEDAVEKISSRVLGDAPSVRQSRPEVSPALERVLAKMMARVPADRYQTPGEVVTALEPHTQDQRQARSPSVAAEISPKSITKRRASVAAKARNGDASNGGPRMRANRNLITVTIAATVVLALVGVAGIVRLLIPTKADPALVPKIASADKEGKVRTLTGHIGPLRGVVFLPDGRRALSASADKTVRLWDLETGKELRQFIGHTDQVLSVALAPDGIHFASASIDRSVRIWDINSDRELQVLRDHPANVNCVSFSPDGHRLIAVGAFQEAFIWDWRARKTVDRIKVPNGCWCAAFGPGKEETFAITPGVPIWLFTGNDRNPRVFEGHTLDVRGLAISPSGSLIASSSFDGTVRLWDVSQAREIRRLTNHLGVVSSVAFSPDGWRILSAGADGTLRLWETDTGQQLRRMEGHGGNIPCMAISPDGRYALSGGDDSALILWRLPD